MTGQQHAMLIDQYGRGESNRADAVGDLANLLLRMRARITRVRLDVVERNHPLNMWHATSLTAGSLAGDLYLSWG